MYPLPEILLVVLCATLGGAEDFFEVASWGPEEARLPPPAPALRARRRLARHPNDVMNALPADLFADCFTDWVESLREEARPRGGQRRRAATP